MKLELLLVVLLLLNCTDAFSGPSQDFKGEPIPVYSKTLKVAEKGCEGHRGVYTLLVSEFEVEVVCTDLHVFNIRSWKLPYPIKDRWRKVQLWLLLKRFTKTLKNGTMRPKKPR